jgi:hypothetical protein
MRLFEIDPAALRIGERAVPQRSPASKGKGINPIVGADIKSLVGCDQRLETMQAHHCFVRASAREQRLAGFSLESMEAIIAVSPDCPDNRIGVPVRRSDDRRTGTKSYGAPRRRQSRPIISSDFEHGEVASRLTAGQ